MGLPRMKRKRLHFKSIEFFTVCVKKYFSPVVNQILNQDNENYGGLRQTLLLFQDKIYKKLTQDEELGVNGRNQKLKI